MKNIILILFFCCSIYSQVTQEWVVRYNGPGNGSDNANSIVIDGFGNVNVTGYIAGIGTGEDYFTIKYNSSGVQQWASIYNGPGNGTDHARSIKVDIWGNVYVTGASSGIGTGLDFATIKYNSLGVQQWVSRYNGPGNGDDETTIPSSIAVDSSENVYVTGPSLGIGSDRDYATVKYNSSGIQQWVQRYNGPGNSADYSFSIAVDLPGNVYVTGYSRNGSSTTTEDYATIKYDGSGSVQWIQRYAGPGNGIDWANSLAVDASGNVYVTGQSLGIGTGADYATIKYNSTGVQQWVTRYNGPGNGSDIAYSISLDNSGYVYVTGHSLGNGTDFDFATIKYNSTGVQQWVTRYNGTGNGVDIAHSVVADGLGNVYVTGESGGTGQDYTTIKYNSSGVQQWLQRYNGPGNNDDIPWPIAIDASSNVFVTGYSAGIGTGSDFATIKYSQSVGIQIISKDVPETYSLSQNYPNPFNPVTKIRFDIPLSRGVSAEGGRGVSIIIYDILGREVETLVNKQLQPGTYEADFDGINYPSGVYYYKLITDGFNKTKKMILLK